MKLFIQEAILQQNKRSYIKISLPELQNQPHLHLDYVFSCCIHFGIKLSHLHFISKKNLNFKNKTQKSVSLGPNFHIFLYLKVLDNETTNKNRQIKCKKAIFK